MALAALIFRVENNTYNEDDYRKEMIIMLAFGIGMEIGISILVLMFAMLYDSGCRFNLD